MPIRSYAVANPSSVSIEDTLSYSVTHLTTYYATKLFDVRYQSRRFFNYVRRGGIEAEYFEAYFCPACTRDPYNYTYNNVAFEDGMYVFKSVCNVCNNTGIMYLPPKTIKIFFGSNQQSSSQAEGGRIETESAMLTVPLVANFKRLDIIRSMDKIWMIDQEPTYLYSQHRSNVIGLSLVCKGLRHTISKY